MFLQRKHKMVQNFHDPAVWDDDIEYNFICVLINHSFCRIALCECSINLNCYDKQSYYGGHNRTVLELYSCFRRTVLDLALDHKKGLIYMSNLVSTIL